VVLKAARLCVSVAGKNVSMIWNQVVRDVRFYLTGN